MANQIITADEMAQSILDTINLHASMVPPEKRQEVITMLLNGLSGMMFQGPTDAPWQSYLRQAARCGRKVEILMGDWLPCAIVDDPDNYTFHPRYGRERYRALA